MRSDQFNYYPAAIPVFTARLGALGFSILAMLAFAGIPAIAYGLGTNFNVLVVNTTTAMPFWLGGIGCALLFEAYVSRLFFVLCAADLQWLLWQPTRADLFGRMGSDPMLASSIDFGGAALLLALTAYVFSRR